MFYGMYENSDPFNQERKRTIANADRHQFNCGGYALNTFSWYCPNPYGVNNDDYYGFWDENEAWHKTLLTAGQMVAEFEGRVRIIPSLESIDKRTEYAVAFRLASDGDFHFMRKCGNGTWYHKMGRCHEIIKITEQEVFRTEWCGGRYDGPIVLLAVLR